MPRGVRAPRPHLQPAGDPEPGLVRRRYRGQAGFGNPALPIKTTALALHSLSEAAGGLSLLRLEMAGDAVGAQPESCGWKWKNRASRPVFPSHFCPTRPE